MVVRPYKKMKKKVLSAVVAATIIFTTVMPVVPVSATPVNEEVREVQNKFGELEREVNELNEQVQILDSKINPLADKINENNRQISNINKEIDNTKKEIEQSKIDISEKEELLGDRLREIYKSGGQTSYLSIILGADSFSDLISKIDSANRIVNLDRKVVEDLVERKDKLSEKVDSLEDKSSEIVKINEDTKKQKQELDIKRNEQQSLVDEAKAKQDEFNRVYLVPKEREMVKPQIDICLSSESSLDQLKSAIDQLTALRSAGQIISSEVDQEVINAIERAKENIDKKEDEESVANRGPATVATGTVSAVLNEAYKHLGKSYVWGAKGPNNFDCSGFTSYVYRHAAGVEIGGSTFSQINAGREVSYSELQPGDLVFPHSGHVGIYVGNGQMIHAPRTGDVVKVGPVYKFWRARRILN